MKHFIKIAAVAMALLVARGPQAGQAHPQNNPVVPSLPSTDLTAETSSATALIDQKIAEHWNERGISPTAVSNDYEFIRRLSLDLRGVIPSSDEVRAFAAEPGTQKREKLIDQWLKGDAFAEYWSILWTEELIGANYEIGEIRIKYTHGLDQWLMNAFFKNNMPYNQLVTKLLASNGPLKSDPAVRFLMSVLVWPYETGQMETTVRSIRFFFGQQMKCAECHDHPFDDWTQDEFRSMVGFFRGSRVDHHESGDREWSTGTILYDPPKDEKFPPKFKGTGAGPREGESRRSAFARFIVSDPQFARTSVNRFWGLLMGRGLVQPLDGFSAQTKASHPGLLNALADDFRQNGFNVRRLLKSILLSRAYQLSSEFPKGAPDDQVFAHGITVPMRWRQVGYSLLLALGLDDSFFKEQNPQ